MIRNDGFARITVLVMLLALALASPALAQYDAETYNPIVLDDDHGELPPIGFESIMANSMSHGFGYNYSALMADMNEWVKSPLVTASNIGTSVQGRTIWQLSITSPANIIVPRKVIAIHARTHPNEVQGTYVVNSIIDHLLSGDPAMRKLLEQAVFNIIPMYNPDGVELDSPRVNANGYDLEREWDKNPPQIEAAQLKARYSAIMMSPTPISVMLNLHSAYLCERYFVYHVASATSEQFAQQEQRFISAVVRYFPDGIQPWHRYQSWQNGAPTHFPESWFWSNYRESVMALTYEDMHCAANGAYDTTAYAILRGIADYLNLNLSGVDDERSITSIQLLRDVAPNPTAGVTTVRYALPSQMHVSLRVFNALGEEVARLVDETQDPGWHEARFNAAELPEGVYYCTIQADATTNTLPVIKIR